MHFALAKYVKSYLIISFCLSILCTITYVHIRISYMYDCTFIYILLCLRFIYQQIYVDSYILALIPQVFRFEDKMIWEPFIVMNFHEIIVAIS